MLPKVAMTEETSKPVKTGKRGPKPGSPQRGGIPKGTILPKTLQKLEGKALLREMVLAELGPIVRAVVAKAKGINHMMLRDETTGQWIRLTEQEQIEKALNAPGAAEGKTFWIHTKDPDIPAAVTLLDRAIGKPVEEQNVNLTVNAPLAERIAQVKEKVRNGL